jgi:predicted transcriptional regulator
MSRSPKRWYRRMTPERAAEIRRRYLAREARQRELAAEYGVAQNTVSRIVSGQVWAR